MSWHEAPLAALTESLAGRYRIEREIGTGGMATVYLAEDIRHRRKVAIKVVRQDLSAAVGATRFLREIEITANLVHPNILAVHDSGDAGGMLYYVMPYISGESLRQKLAREGALPVAESIRLLREIADALAAAHRAGVVHRDIKPENILIQDGHALLMDFGIARAVADASMTTTLTQAGTSIGTPAYMAPEQAAADPRVDARADIYAFGVIAYEMLAGQTPFVGSTAQQVIAAHMTTTPASITSRRQGLPAPLAAMVMQCLAKHPADRPQSATALIDALDRALVAPPAAGPNLRQLSVGMRRIAAAAAFVSLACAGYLLVTRHNSSSAPSSIAVIPFENLSSDTAMVFFAEGMADEMATALTSIPSLRVMARTSAGAFEGRRATAQEIGRALHVDVVLMGSVRREGNRLVIAAHVDRTSDGTQLFAERFDTAYSDVFRVQESLARSIAQKLKVSMAPAATDRPHTQAGTRDTEAYDDFLKGQRYFGLRGADNLRLSMDYYRRAVTRDSSFARAYAGYAMAAATLPLYMAAGPDSFPAAAERAARHALALDPTLTMGHVALASVFYLGARPAQAVAELATALQLDPDCAICHQWRGGALLQLARIDEAIVELTRAAQLDPLSTSALSDLTYGLIVSRRYLDAIVAGRNALAIDSMTAGNYLNIGLAYAFAQHPDTAGMFWTRAFLIDSTAPTTRAYYTWGLALTGKVNEAIHQKLLLEGAEKAGGYENDLTIANIGLGDRKAALQWAKRAAAARSPSFVGSAAGCDPTYDLIANDSGYRALLPPLGQVACTNRRRD